MTDELDEVIEKMTRFVEGDDINYAKQNSISDQNIFEQVSQDLTNIFKPQYTKFKKPYMMVIICIIILPFIAIYIIITIKR